MYKGGDFMRKQSTKTQNEFCDNTKKQDEALLKLLKQGRRELIISTIKDYLSSLE